MQIEVESTFASVPGRSARPGSRVVLVLLLRPRLSRPAEAVSPAAGARLAPTSPPRSSASSTSERSSPAIFGRSPVQLAVKSAAHVGVADPAVEVLHPQLVPPLVKVARDPIGRNCSFGQLEQGQDGRRVRPLGADVAANFRSVERQRDGAVDVAVVLPSAAFTVNGYSPSPWASVRWSRRTGGQAAAASPAGASATTLSASLAVGVERGVQRGARSPARSIWGSVRPSMARRARPRLWVSMSSGRACPSAWRRVCR